MHQLRLIKFLTAALNGEPGLTAGLPIISTRLSIGSRGTAVSQNLRPDFFPALRAGTDPTCDARDAVRRIGSSSSSVQSTRKFDFTHVTRVTGVLKNDESA